EGPPGPTAPAEQFPNKINMQMVLIKKGTFKMGSPPEDEDKRGDEVAQHQVKITRDFYLGATEVTRGQFKQFVEGKRYKTEAESSGAGGTGVDKDATISSRNPIYNWKNIGLEQDDNHPVVNVTWNDAVAFCQWLSEKEG